MTAPAYDPLTNDDTGADKILTTGTVQALDTNPVAIAQRGANAPIVQPPVREYKTSGTSATWPIPDGVTAFTIYVGGGNGGNGGTPGDTTVVYNGVTYTGEAGSNGSAGSSAVGGVGGVGGAATNGDYNIEGQRGGDGGGAGEGGMGATRAVWGGNAPRGTGGSLGNGGRGGGGAGGMCIKRIVVVAGQTSATYTIGAGGTDADGGLVVFEY